MGAVLRHGALDELVVRLREPLLRYFRRRVAPGEEADDLVQDVFSRLAAQDLRGIGNVDGYVFQIAANILRDRVRRASVRSIICPTPDRFDVEDEAGFSPERLLQSREALRAMVAAIEELPESVRTVFCQYHLEGVTQVEIARQLGLSLSTVEKRMARGNGHLLRRLRDIL